MTDQTYRPINILHVFGKMDRGGAELRTVDLLRYSNKDCFKFVFCTLSGQPGELDEEISQLGGIVVPCRLGAMFPWRLRRLILQHDIDVVHSHVHHVSGLIVAFCRVFGVPMRIVHFRSTQDRSSMSSFRKLRRRVLSCAIDNCAHNILGVSESVLSAAWSERWQSDPRCLVVYNGLDAGSYSPIPGRRESVRAGLSVPDDSILVCHVGRFHESKNQEKVVRIFGEIMKRLPQARLLLVGRGGTVVEEQVREIEDQLGVSSKVEHLGQRNDIADLMRAADLQIFPSRWEGLPGALLEACATGLPSIASDIPSNIEVYRHFPRSVSIVGLEDSDESWASRAMELLASEHDRVAAHRHFVDSPFSLSRTVSTMQDVWGRAMSLQ